MRLIFGETVWSWWMLGLVGKDAKWFIGYSRALHTREGEKQHTETCKRNLRQTPPSLCWCHDTTRKVA